MPIYRTSKARENILARIRKELGNERLPMPYPDAEINHNPVFASEDLADEEVFALNFSKTGGKFVYCDNEQELIENLCMLVGAQEWKTVLCNHARLLRLFANNKIELLQNADTTLEDADACITDCEFAVARTGSFLFSSRQQMGRTSTVFYPIHIVLVFADQVVRDIEDGMTELRKKYGAQLPSMISLATGPSRTADIEKTLVVGVHGPKEVYCFFVNSFA